MTPILLVLGAQLGALAATSPGDPVDLAFKALNLGLAGVFLYLLISGVLRRAGEVEEANKRADDERDRADREAQNRQRIQDEVFSDLSPALIRNAEQGQRMVEAATRQADQMSKLIDAVLQRIARD